MPSFYSVYWFSPCFWLLGIELHTLIYHRFRKRPIQQISYHSSWFYRLSTAIRMPCLPGIQPWITVRSTNPGWRVLQWQYCSLGYSSWSSSPSASWRHQSVSQYRCSHASSTLWLVVSTVSPSGTAMKFASVAPTVLFHLSMLGSSSQRLSGWGRP